jgi:predicted TIM-barrel fold metal-dependent hydrolase
MPADPWTRPRETILEPDLPIVDPHHHLWDRPAAVIASLPPPKHGFDHLIRRVPRYLLDELLADAGSGHNVVATVFLECGAMYRRDEPGPMRVIGETEFVNGVAAQCASGLYGDIRACAGIVSHVDLMLGDGAGAILEAHIAAGNGRFRGIRHACSSDPDPDVLGPLSGRAAGLYREAKFREGFAHLSRLGLSFDAWLLEPQLPDLISLARAFPTTPIVLDHVGTPLGIGSYKGRREERFGVWRDNIRALAACPNVTVKLGGLAMVFPGFDSFMSVPPKTSVELAAEWKPYIETCIEAFGPSRAMFESNFPVDIGACDYATLWNAFKRITAGYSADDKAALYAGAATSFYRLKY